jgi:hypothetical protein
MRRRAIARIPFFTLGERATMRPETAIAVQESRPDAKALPIEVLAHHASG